LAAHQFTRVRARSESPLRQYARDTVGFVEEDAVTGVLLERVAGFLCLQLRALHGRPTARLDQVPPGEANQMRSYAAGILHLVEAIRGEQPPTALELARYEVGKQVVLARGRVRVQARSHSHRLGVWRPDPYRPDHELVTCEACGAGATLNVQSAHESLSTPLLTLCPEWRRDPLSTSGEDR
jgi:hypothetical protein